MSAGETVMGLHVGGIGARMAGLALLAGVLAPAAPALAQTAPAAGAQQVPPAVPEVRVRHNKKGELVEEYYRAGALYMERIHPHDGAPYTHFIGEHDEVPIRHVDGFDQALGDPHRPPVGPVQYKLIEWGGRKPQPADQPAAPAP